MPRHIGNQPRRHLYIKKSGEYFLRRCHGRLPNGEQPKYQALQTGVVDGTENVWSNMYTLKFHEVQKHATLTNHGYIGYAVIVNKPFWDGLPPDIRTVLEQAMRETTTFANQIAQKENDDALAAIRASGLTEVHDLTAVERAAWREVLQPVQAEMETRVGKELLTAIRRETDAAP